MKLVISEIYNCLSCKSIKQSKYFSNNKNSNKLLHLSTWTTVILLIGLIGFTQALPTVIRIGKFVDFT